MCSFHWQKCEPRSKLFIPLDIFSSFRGIYTLFSLCAVYCYWLTRGISHFYEERAYPHWQQNCLFRQIFCHHPTLYKCGWFVATWQFFAEADKFSIASPTKLTKSANADGPKSEALLSWLAICLLFWWFNLSGCLVTTQILRAKAFKNRTKLKYRGQSRKIFPVFFFPMDRYWLVTKHDVVCFQQGRFNLEKTDKIYFCRRLLQNSQNLGRNGSFSKLACIQ